MRHAPCPPPTPAIPPSPIPLCHDHFFHAPPHCGTKLMSILRPSMHSLSMLDANSQACFPTAIATVVGLARDGRGGCSGRGSRHGRLVAALRRLWPSRHPFGVAGAVRVGLRSRAGEPRGSRRFMAAWKAAVDWRSAAGAKRAPTVVEVCAPPGGAPAWFAPAMAPAPGDRSTQMAVCPSEWLLGHLGAKRLGVTPRQLLGTVWRRGKSSPR